MKNEWDVHGMYYNSLTCSRSLTKTPPQPIQRQMLNDKRTSYQTLKTN